jgi:hypothetical protein
MPRFNEGKACDAIARRIEARLGRARGQMCFPENEQHAGPVDLVCKIGDHLFAFEHTGIEPFEGHVSLDAKSDKHLQAIRDLVEAALPSGESYTLYIPAGATLGLSGPALGRVLRAIATWIIATAPQLPMIRRTDPLTGPHNARIPDVPFPVSLTRAEPGPVPAGFHVVHLVERDTEKRRVERIRRAYKQKMPKLGVWKQLGARTVLILEENDIQLTSHWAVASAVMAVEKGILEKPDEVYLVSTVVTNEWTSWILRMDDSVYAELSVWGDSLRYVDPEILKNITG